MTPFDAAHRVLTDVPTLDASTIKAAVTAALLAAMDDLPVDVSSIEVTVSKRAKKRLGRCRYRRTRDEFGDTVVRPFEINISLAGAALASREDLADTIAHEVAHASLPYDIKHCHVWQARARKYGATPEACAVDHEINRSYRYAYYCPECEECIGRQAGRPRNRRRCNACASLVATVDLRERQILPGHSVTSSRPNADVMFTEAMRPIIDDYREARDAILTLNRTA